MITNIIYQFGEEISDSQGVIFPVEIPRRDKNEIYALICHFPLV